MLTHKQRELLLLIHNRMSRGELAPSFDEMRDLLGLKSKSGIHRLITGLVERGYLQRLPHRARALEVVKLPEGYNPAAHDQTSAATITRNINRVVTSAHGHGGAQWSDDKTISTGIRDNAGPPANILTVPLMGRIAAGTPIEAIRDDGASIDIPADMVGRGDFYALTVQGDSMIDAGIHSGDTVVIRRGDSAENGRIVVALVDDTEVTLKRLRRKDGMIILQAENPAFEDRSLPPDRVKVQGELATLIRMYR